MAAVSRDAADGNRIYSAKINGNQIRPPALVMKSPEVVNIHWAFDNHTAGAGTGGL